MSSRLTPEELRARQLEQRALTGMPTIFDDTLEPHSARDAQPLVHRHHQQQRLRLEVYEHQMRNALVVAEATTFAHHIANPWRTSDVSLQLQLKAVEESEQTWRAAAERETRLTMDRLFTILNRVFEEAVAKFGGEGEETTDMRAMAMEEAELRRHVLEQYQGAASSAVLATIEPEERAWRATIFRDYAQDARRVWGVLLGAQFLWLLSPAGGAGGVMSEAEQRVRLVRQEWFSRASAAVRFCQLQLQWHEEWQRMTMMFVERLNFHYTRLAFRIESDELNERRALRTLYTPLSLDIQEQVEENEPRRRRMENKLQALKNLRSVELARVSAQRFESDDYAAIWRARELADIEALHNQILSSVAQFYAGDRMGGGGGGGGGGPGSPSSSAIENQLRSESPALQKLRAFASSSSPSPARRQQQNQQQNSNQQPENSNQQQQALGAILKLDQALIDLHGHHEDVMQKLAAPTTTFDEIVEYRKSLQVKSGPKLTSQAESEVKQLKGVLNAEIARIQHGASAMMRRRGGGAAAVGVPLHQDVLHMHEEMMKRRSVSVNTTTATSPSPPSAAAAGAAAAPLVSQYVRASAAAAAAGGGAASSGYLGADGASSQIYDEDDMLLPSPGLTLNSVRDWCVQTAHSLSP